MGEFEALALSLDTPLTGGIVMQIPPESKGRKVARIDIAKNEVLSGEAANVCIVLSYE